ncbi:MAG: replication-relaxation family protein [Blastocatellia bacterium]
MDEEQTLICLIRDYPLITVEQLCRLTGRPMQSVGRSLLKLCKERRSYINRNEKRQTPNTPHIYAITKYAAQEKEIGGYPIDLSERKDKGISHEILINDIHIALKDQVIYWRQYRKTLWRHGIQPDAFFKLQLGDKKRSFFLEAETGSNNPQDILAKCRGYERLRQIMKKETLDWLPMVKFSVLTIRPSAESAQALADEVFKEKIIDPDYKTFYIFSTLPITQPLIN